MCSPTGCCFTNPSAANLTNCTPINVPQSVGQPLDLLAHFNKAFQRAMEVTGDYETLFYPLQEDWAGPRFLGTSSRPMPGVPFWANSTSSISRKSAPTFLGGIFQKLIAPEERHKFGQHYTNEDLVDVVNAFCIRKAEDVVLDPACGSGSFLDDAKSASGNLNGTTPRSTCWYSAPGLSL